MLEIQPMRTEKDFIGSVDIPKDALYGIHSVRAAENFPDHSKFHMEWYKATGIVKLACYNTYTKFKAATSKEYPELIDELRLLDDPVIQSLIKAAGEVSKGKHFKHFIVPAIQGGAGTSINLNINEIIANRALILMGKKPGDYESIDPLESANIYQSTNDVIPTALTVAVMELLKDLESSVNETRAKMEGLEKKYRNTLRLAYTQMQEAVPSTYGILFSTYSDALSRDWWRVSKAFERIKQVNLGGGAIGTGISIPLFFIMEVAAELKRITGLPVAQGENLSDITANQDSYVEVHAILKAHAVNMEKMVSDIRLLASGINAERELSIPDKQTGSTIMPGKVNPVIPEFIISSAHQIYANDHLISELSAMGCLELNAYLPSIGNALLDTLKLLIAMNRSLQTHLLTGLEVDREVAAARLFNSPGITTALSPLIGYHKAAELARYMKEEGKDIFEANSELKIMDQSQLKEMMKPEMLLKKGFTMRDIKDFNEASKASDKNYKDKNRR